MDTSPFRFSDLLTNSYYVVSILIVVLGLLTMGLNIKWQVDELNRASHEHPLRAELVEVAIRVDNRLGTLEKQIEELDRYGTRALSDRTTQIEQTLKQLDARSQEVFHRLNELQAQLNKVINELPVIVDRQATNSSAIRELQQRIWGGSGSEKGPTGAAHYPPQR